MVGLGKCASWFQRHSWLARIARRFSSGLSSRLRKKSSISWPALQLSPAPVRTSAFASGATASCESAAIISSCICGLIALRLSGRFIVTQARSSATSTFTVWNFGKSIFSSSGGALHAPGNCSKGRCAPPRAVGVESTAAEGPPMKVTTSGETLGATVAGLDLAQPLSQDEFDAVLRALGRFGVVRFPRQELTGRQLADFSARFGKLEINVANAFQEPGIPEVMILSNVVENGEPVGLADAGQDWHTDMSYSRTIALANVLYGIKIPRRVGKPLGATEFANMHAAYDGLPAEMRRDLEGMTVLHDFNKFWEMMRRDKGSRRPPLSEAQKKAKPPVSHPIFLTHPITGRKVLYANPGYSIRINELPQKESDEMLEFLFEHQLRPEYRYAFHWNEGDVLMWEDIGTIHNAVADYGPDEHRLVKRCQVMATMFYSGAREER